MSEKAELWHNLLELSGIRGDDYYIWSACQAEVQGLFNSCDLKIAPGLRDVQLYCIQLSRRANDWSASPLGWHGEGSLSETLVRFYFYRARLLLKLFQNSFGLFRLDSTRNFQVRWGLRVRQDSERSSHDRPRELHCVNSNLTPRLTNVKGDITNRKNKQNTLKLSLSAFLLLFLWLLTLFKVTPVVTIVSNPYPCVKVFVSGSEQEIPFDPPRMLRQRLSSAGRFNDILW